MMNKYPLHLDRCLLLLSAIFGVLISLSIVWLVEIAHASLPTTPLSTQAPVIRGIHPQSASNDLDTMLVITGTGFSAIFSGTEIITPPAASLGSHSLIDVTWVNSALLTATVSWGLNPGGYTLTVTNPDGAFASLPGAFTVTQGLGTWTSGGPYGGGIHDIDINPITTTQVYALVDGVGVFGSRDSATYWEPLLIDLPSPRLAIDPNNPKIMYVTTSSGFRRSQDGGASWEILTIPVCHAGGEFLPFINAAYTNTIYLAADCLSESGTAGVWKSTDRGETWIQLGLADQNIRELAFHPDNPHIIYAGERDGGIFTSTNDGETWELVYSLNHGYLWYMVVNPYGEHETWVVTRNPYLLYRSIEPDLTDWELQTFTDQSIWSLTFHPNISGTLYVATSLDAIRHGVISTDWGETWQSLGEGLPDAGFFAVAPSPTATLTSTVLYVGGGYGIWKSSDGGQTWAESNDHLAGVIPSTIAVSPDDSYEVYASTYGGNRLWKSQDGGQSWRTLNTPYGSHGAGWGSNLVVDPFLPERVYFSSQWVVMPLTFPAVDISEDGGTSWHTVEITVPVTYQDWNSWANYISPDPLIPGHLLVGVSFQSPDQTVRVGGIYASNDYGETWSYIETGLSIGPIYNIAFARSDSQVVYATTLANEIADGVGLIKSLDGGDTWQALPGDVTGALALAVNPQDSQDVYAGFYFPGTNCVHRSQDGGFTWTKTGGDFDSGIVWTMAFTPTDPPVLYAGEMRIGLLRYVENSDTWVTAFGGEGVQVQSLATTRDGERVIIYVGTSGAAGSMMKVDIRNNNVVMVGAGVYRYTHRYYCGFLPVIHK